MGVFRSFLFTPGNHPRKVEKVFGIGADAVILDLEDAVAIAEKPATRATIVAALKRERRCLGYVRVNAYDTEFCYGDFVGVVGPWLDGIILPKVESPDQLRAADWLLGNLEREQGMEIGGIDLIPIIETGKGMHAVYDIAAAATRTRRLSFGAGDFTLDMNLDWPLDESTLAHARASIVQASRAAGIEPPLDTVWIHVKDLENLEKSTRLAKQMGFQGKPCIYPPQVEEHGRATWRERVFKDV